MSDTGEKCHTVETQDFRIRIEKRVGADQFNGILHIEVKIVSLSHRRKGRKRYDMKDGRFKE